MLRKEDYELAWNAALEHATEHIEDWVVSKEVESLKAPSSSFDEWYEREVANPPDTWDSHHD